MNSEGDPPPPELEAGTDSEEVVQSCSHSHSQRICIADSPDTPHPKTEKEEAKGQGEAGKRPAAQACEAGETAASRETTTTRNHQFPPPKHEKPTPSMEPSAQIYSTTGSLCHA